MFELEVPTEVTTGQLRQLHDVAVRYAKQVNLDPVEYVIGMLEPMTKIEEDHTLRPMITNLIKYHVEYLRKL